MGQRTQIWIEHQGFIQNENTKEKEIAYRNFAFHEQWGYGQGLILRLMMILSKTTMTSFDEYSGGINFNTLLKGSDSNLMDEYRNYYKDDPENSENVVLYENTKAPKLFVKDFLSWQDNNDGYLVVRLGTINDPNYSSFAVEHLQFGFYDHNLKFMPWEKYLDQYPDFKKDKDLKKLFKSYLKWYFGEDCENACCDVLKEWERPLFEIETKTTADDSKKE